jgi:hypothetical protein
VTAPQFPAAWGQTPGPAQQPVQASPPGYPPQQFAQPGYPQQPPAQYAPPAPPQYPPAAPGQYYQPQPGLPQGYPPAAPAYDPYAAAQPPAFTPAQGSLDDYMNQRPAGAAYWKFPAPGHVNIGMVERDLRDSDTHQVSFNGQPVRRKDGSISGELVLDVPLVNPDGTKSIMEFKGHQRTAFEEAVSAGSGGKRRLPEAGSMIRGTFTHTEPSRGGGSPKKIIRWEYVPADQVQQQGGAPANPLPAAPAQPPQDLQYATPVPGPQQYQQPAMQAPPAQPPQYVAQTYDGQQWQPPFPAQQNGHAPQQAAPAQQVPPAAAPTTPPAAQQAPAPAPSPNGQPQGPPAPQPYAAPGLDPQAQAMFGNLLGGAPAQ